MSKPGGAKMWVVYSQPVHGQEGAVSAVCEQGEWDALEIIQPGRRTLVQSGITSEAEAERLARVGAPVGPKKLRAYRGNR
jgi:hypothetical protein